MSLVALSALLCIHRVQHPFLPKDGRTLFKTKTQYSLETLASGGFFWHLALAF